MSSYLLIDVSYMIFYRYYAILSWYRKAFPDEQDFKGEIINEKFKKKFLDGIDELSKKHKTPYNNIFICCDCPQEQIWRKKIFPDYKKGRKEDTEVPKAFRIFFEDIYPLLETKNIQLFKCDHAEADDIISVITRELQNEHLITIITSDQDYLQLINNNTQIFTLKKTKNNLKDKSLGDPQLDLKVKIIIGDKSDNISGCFPRCGLKTAIKYIKENKLDSIFKKYPGSKEKYEFNQKIIDFDYVPIEIKKNILEQLKKIKKNNF